MRKKNQRRKHWQKRVNCYVGMPVSMRLPEVTNTLQKLNGRVEVSPGDMDRWGLDICLTKARRDLVNGVAELILKIADIHEHYSTINGMPVVHVSCYVLPKKGDTDEL